MDTPGVQRPISGIITVILAILFLFSVEGLATTYYVSDADGNDIWAGTDPNYPKATIQAAIDDANDNDTVIIAVGTYRGQYNRDLDFSGKAITVHSVDPNAPNIVAATIIDCNGTYADQHRGFYFHNGEGADSVLSGVTIKNGYALSGGGILCTHGCGPTITNCIIRKCRAYNNGGGISGCEGSILNCTITDNEASKGGGLYGCSTGLISNCVISNNQADNGGGFYGCSNPIINCTITGNEADNGGGFYGCSNSVLTNCSVTGNLAYIDGGGLNGCLATIIDCNISENTANNNGGGLKNCHGPITNCVIIGNLADGNGGGLNNCDGKISKCTITNNTANGDGGGFDDCDDQISECIISENWGWRTGGLWDCRAQITNCIVSGNSANNGSGGLCLCNGPIINCTIVGNSTAAEEGAGAVSFCQGNISSCIIWGNKTPQLIKSTPSYSCIEGWSGFGNNISDNPLFADPNNNDYHLKSQVGRWYPNSQIWVFDGVTSPCIDGGNPGLDWTDELWPNGQRANMGAYGRTAQASMSVCDGNDTWLIADLSHDYIVNFKDFALLSKSWPVDDVLLAEDLDRNGMINYGDLRVFTDYWLDNNEPCFTAELQEDFETGDFNRLDWQHYGDKPWALVVNDTNNIVWEGTYTARSGNLSNSQQSVLEVTLEFESNRISFYRKVSSETDCDYLYFYVDGTEANKWSGQQDWSLQTYEITPGQHTFKWVYEKDFSAVEGSDCAWIDDIRFYFDPREQ